MGLPDCLAVSLASRRESDGVTVYRRQYKKENNDSSILDLKNPDSRSWWLEAMSKNHKQNHFLHQFSYIFLIEILNRPVFVVLDPGLPFSIFFRSLVIGICTEKNANILLFHKTTREICISFSVIFVVTCFIKIAINTDSSVPTKACLKKHNLTEISQICPVDGHIILVTQVNLN